MIDPSPPVWQTRISPRISLKIQHAHGQKMIDPPIHHPNLQLFVSTGFHIGHHRGLSHERPIKRHKVPTLISIEYRKLYYSEHVILLGSIIECQMSLRNKNRSHRWHYWHLWTLIIISTENSQLCLQMFCSWYGWPLFEITRKTVDFESSSNMLTYYAFSNHIYSLSSINTDVFSFWHTVFVCQ